MDHNNSCEKLTKDIAGEGTSGNVIFAYFVLVSTILIVPITSFHFFQNINNYVALARRNLFLISMFSFSSTVYIVISCIRVITGADEFPCVVLLFVVNLAFYTPVIAGCARLISLFWRIQFNKSLIEKSYSALLKGELNIKVGTDNFVQKDQKAKPSFYQPILEERAPERNMSETMWFDYFYPCVAFIICWDKETHLPEGLQFQHLRASKYFINCLFVAFFSIVAIVIAIRVQFALGFASNCAGCLTGQQFKILPGRLVIYFGLTFMVIALLIQLRRMPDALGIKQEILVFVGFFDLFLGVLSIVSLITESMKKREIDGSFDLNVLTAFAFLIGHIYTTSFQVWRAKKMNTVMLDAEVELVRVLGSQEGKKAFSLYLVSNLSLETLFFYEAAQDWRSNYDRRSPQERILVADIIYNRFVVNDAFLSINIPGSIRNNIGDAMENGLSREMFEDAAAEMFALMETDIFPRFIQSDYYRAYGNQIAGVN